MKMNNDTDEVREALENYKPVHGAGIMLGAALGLLMWALILLVVLW